VFGQLAPKGFGLFGEILCQAWEEAKLLRLVVPAPGRGGGADATPEAFGLIRNLPVKFNRLIIVPQIPMIFDDLEP